MIHQIKAQLNASLEKIDRSSKIENLCSKLSATLAMASAIDSHTGNETFFAVLYSQVENYLMSTVDSICSYDKKEEPAD